MNTNTIVQPSERAESIGRLLGLPSLMHWAGKAREAIKVHDTDPNKFYVFSGIFGKTTLYRFECDMHTDSFTFITTLTFKEQAEKNPRMVLPPVHINADTLRRSANMLSGLDTSIEYQDYYGLHKAGILEVWYYMYQNRIK